MSRNGKVLLSAWVEPVIRDYARSAADCAGMDFSSWVARAVRQAAVRESTDRALTKAAAREGVKP